MILDFLPDRSNDCPILRIYDFDLVEAEAFVSEIEKMANGVFDSLPIHHLPFVDAIDGCLLTAMIGVRAEGVDMVTPLPDANSFAWIGSRDEWRHIIDLILPLEGLMTPNHYQWLTDDFGVQILLHPPAPPKLEPESPHVSPR